MNTRQKQWQLKCLGYYKGEIDNQWGKQCEAATKQFQRDHQLVADGLFGPATEQESITAMKVHQRTIGANPDGFGGPKTWDKMHEHIPQEPNNGWDSLRYIHRNEFRCQCRGRYCNGFHVEPSLELAKLLEQVREHFGAPLTITSGLRCPRHNATIKGASPKSKHVEGIAADIVVDGVAPITVYNYINTLIPKSGGLGVYPGHVHADVRQGYSRWDNR